MHIPGNLFIITAPSGAGKSSLVRNLLAADPEVALSVSCTTRAPRPSEIDGVHYHFVSEARFAKMLEAGEFLESALVHGAHYGTLHAEVEKVLHSGRDLVLEIDWQGAMQVRSLYSGAIGIFILPPSPQVLAERLQSRGQDSAEAIAHRLAAAKEEISHVGEFDYVIINNQFDTALQDLFAIVRAQRLRGEKQLWRQQALLQAFNQ